MNTMKTKKQATTRKRLPPRSERAIANGKHDHSERCIFRYWDGVRVRGIDPLKAIRELASDPTFNPATHPELALVEDLAVSLPATNAMVSATRRVFELAEWSEDEKTGNQTGMTDGEALQTYSTFAGFVNALKKNGNPSPTTPPATEPVLSTVSDGKAEPTSVSSDST